MRIIDVLDHRHQGSMGEGARSAVDDGRASIGRAGMDRVVAFQRLADVHLARSYRLATVVLGSGTDAQDVVHDAFVTAWRKYDSLRDSACFEAWFDRIVVNTCRDRMRRGRHLQVHDLSARTDLAGADTTAPIADEVVVRRALDQLKPDDRIVLALRFYRDMTIDDISHVLGIHPRTAASRLHRAVERLRHVLDQGRSEAAR